MSEEKRLKKHYIFSTNHELDEDNKFLKEYILNLQQENTQLKQQLNRINERLENMSFSYAGEKLVNELIEQQLKDKDEKISKVKELLEEASLSSLSPFELFKIEEEINEILESNKED